MKIVIDAFERANFQDLCPNDNCGCYAAGDYDGDGCDCVDFSMK